MEVPMSDITYIFIGTLNTGLNKECVEVFSIKKKKKKPYKTIFNTL